MLLYINYLIVFVDVLVNEVGVEDECVIVVVVLYDMVEDMEMIE